MLRFNIAGVESWTMGIDNSDSDKFKITQDTGLHQNQKLVLQGKNYQLGEVESKAFSTQVSSGGSTTSGYFEWIPYEHFTESGGWYQIDWSKNPNGCGSGYYRDSGTAFLKCWTSWTGHYAPFIHAEYPSEMYANANNLEIRLHDTSNSTLYTENPGNLGTSITWGGSQTRFKVRMTFHGQNWNCGSVTPSPIDVRITKLIGWNAG
jgi:hypothetical protein